MEPVTMAEAQARLADLLAAAAGGETVIIVGADQAQFQLLPVGNSDTYVGRDGLVYYRSHGPMFDAQVGLVYYPVLPAPPKEPLQPGSAAGLIGISEDFDEPLEEFREYME
jgi:antitoxin (DNA-binding transcriptional repressor) of toxin-antitoxin stability system